MPLEILLPVNCLPLKMSANQLSGVEDVTRVDQAKAEIEELQVTVQAQAMEIMRHTRHATSVAADAIRALNSQVWNGTLEAAGRQVWGGISHKH